MKNVLILTVLIASFALVNVVNAAEPECQHPLVLKDGLEFCPDSTADATPALTTAQASLADRMKAVVEELKQVDTAKRNLRDAVAIPAGGSPARPVTTDVSSWWLAGLAVLVVALVLWLFFRNQHHQQLQGDGRVEGDLLIARHPLRVTADPIHLHATVDVAGAVAPAPAVPPAPAGTPCPNCGVPKPDALARFCAACGHALPVVLLLVLFAFGQTASAADNVIRYRCEVNGIQGWCSAPAAMPTPAAPAPRPAQAVQHRAPAPAPRPVNYETAGRDLARGMVEELKRQGFRPDATGGTMSAYMTVPQSPAPASTTAPTPSAGVSQQVADRLTAVERRQNELTTTQNQLGDRLGTAERRLVEVREDVNADHITLGDVGAAAITGSEPDRCRAYGRLMAQGLLAENAKAPKGCKPQK